MLHRLLLCDDLPVFSWDLWRYSKVIAFACSEHEGERWYDNMQMRCERKAVCGWASLRWRIFLEATEVTAENWLWWIGFVLAVKPLRLLQERSICPTGTCRVNHSDEKKQNQQSSHFSQEEKFFFSCFQSFLLCFQLLYWNLKSMKRSHLTVFTTKRMKNDSVKSLLLNLHLETNLAQCFQLQIAAGGICFKDEMISSRNYAKCYEWTALQRSDSDSPNQPAFALDQRRAALSCSRFTFCI